jgi:hypothetical protein
MPSIVDVLSESAAKRRQEDLEHEPEKWKALFRKDHAAQGF